MAPYLSVNHLVHERVTQQPDGVILGVPDKFLRYTKYTYKDLDVAASLLAKHYVDSGLLSGIDYVVNELALSRLGYCILLISPNNSPAAINHLLNQTHAESVIASESLIDVLESALSLAPTGLRIPKIIVQPPSDIYGAAARRTDRNILWQYPLAFEQEGDLPFVIIHSSGSTGHPKPVWINHRAGVENYSLNLGYTSFITLPLYHNHGHSHLYRAFHAGRPIYIYPSGIIPVTTDNILSLLKNPDCDAEAVYAVPLVLTFLSESEEAIEILRRMKAVMSGGSALSDKTGDKLVAAGVRLIVQMGTTETGQIGTSLRDFENDKAWDYIRGPRHLQKFFRFDDQGDGRFELVVLDGYPTKVTSNQPDGSFRTKDLYVMHPTLDCAFKFCGRLDDTLVMINGEKTNPVPIELCLRGQSPYIADAVVFGAGRAQIGALILPSERGKDKSPEELQELIAPAVAIANADAPSHSQLAPESIVFLPYGTPIPRADKGSPIRGRTYVAFEKVINDVYHRLEGTVGSGGTKKHVTTLEEGKMLVHEFIEGTLGAKLDGLTDDADLFALGLNSLQATRIRNAIQRDVEIGPHKLSSNFVFDHPFINEIARCLLDLSSSGHSERSLGPSQADLMLDIVERYRAFASEIRRPSQRGPRKGAKYVLLTGVTGSLGAHLLDVFLADDGVEHIYCLVRASSHGEAEDRVVKSMEIRGLVERYQTQRQRVSYFSADFEKDNLGLSAEYYAELQSNVTHIIHSAWPVNFNLGITSFIPHIEGAVNLMRLALETTHFEPAQFYFCSSISAVLAWPGPGQAPEEITDDPNFAQHMGYARSKWVVEKLCQIASNTSELRAHVFRIGQLVGDSHCGIWNESEAISLMFKSAQTISALPILDDSPAWLPVDTAAQVIFEVTSLLDHDYQGDSLCWNIIQPVHVPWLKIMDHFEAAGLKFKRVPRREWLELLRTSDPDPVRNPTTKLLAFFEEKYGHDDEKLPYRCTLATKKTENASSALRGAPYPDDSLVKKWVANWRRTGFLE